MVDQVAVISEKSRAEALAHVGVSRQAKRTRFLTLPLLLPLIITVTLLQLGGIFRGNLEMFQQMVGNNPLL